MFSHGIRRDMKSVLQPWHLFLFIIAGWVNRHQQDIVEYLRTENQVLKEKLGKKRILLTDDQRRRLAVKGKVYWVARRCRKSLPSSHLTPSFVGIANWWP